MFWHISNIPQCSRGVKIVVIPPRFVKQQYLWNIAIQPAVCCYNSWANLPCSGCSPLGENCCETGLLEAKSCHDTNFFYHWCTGDFVMTASCAACDDHISIYIQWLTHWGRVTHICANKRTIMNSDNGLSPGRRQAITNTGLLSEQPSEQTSVKS